MEDSQIVELYWERSESAIAETKQKYEHYCHYIAYNILKSDMDAEECVNDTYVKAWNSIPPNRPNRLSAYLGKITRNIALDRYEKNKAQKRGGGEMSVVLDELQECIPSSNNSISDTYILKDAINRFLVSLSPDKRKIFMRRYWYLSSIKEISQEYGISQSKAKMTLLRVRNDFKAFLEKEGIDI
ncbi:MAG: sigma-70 family RNA polymerase sigma factor [Eubacterium sp.]|nr:sigma-70 family RNA polymerase sigma factor [Eubacterium sp.]